MNIDHVRIDDASGEANRCPLASFLIRSGLDYWQNVSHYYFQCIGSDSAVIIGHFQRNRIDAVIRIDMLRRQDTFSGLFVTKIPLDCMSIKPAWICKTSCKDNSCFLNDLFVLPRFNHRWHVANDCYRCAHNADNDLLCSG